MDIVDNRLKEIFLLLASDGETQIKCFPEYVDIAEEIAMEVEDILNILLNNKMENSFLNTLKKINLQFDGMGRNENFWNVNAIISHRKWQEIRMMARLELERQNIKYRKPNLFWLQYVEKN